MTPWIILAIMAAFAAGLVSATLLRRIDGHRAGATADVDIPRGQPKEPVSEQAGISNDGSQAETASAEIGHPAPAAGCAERTILVRLASGEGNAAVVAIAGVIVLGLVGLLASIEPPVPTTVSSVTRPNGVLAVERLAALTGQQHLEIGQSPAGSGLASVDDMIDRLAARLQQSPDDPEGWRMLGWSYFGTERFSESAAAYLKAIALRPDFAAFRSLRGEALVKAANGKVTAEAARAFDDALKLDSSDLRARFFKGLAKQQAGDGISALDDWTAILNGGDTNEPWFAELKQRAAELGRELGAGVSGGLRDWQAAASGYILKALTDPPIGASPDLGRKGPTAEEVRTAEAMAPVDRTAMIRGMVEGLANRLEQSPRDVEGWIKLIRSRIVLGQADEAQRALDRALAIFSSAPQERGQIAAAARDFGLLQ